MRKRIMANRPAKITLDRHDARLVIIWDDGLVSRYPLSHLREACPCVECPGGHFRMGLEHAPADILQLTPGRSYNMLSLSPVGNYAVQPAWDDGHATGIYTWEYLRLISPQQPADGSGADTSSESAGS